MTYFSNKIRVHYETSPQCSALQWLRPEQTAGKRHPYLFSQCQVGALFWNIYFEEYNCFLWSISLLYFIIYWDKHETQRIVKNLLLRRKVEEILSSLRNILMKLHEVPDQFLDHNDKFCFLVLLAFISIYLYYLFFMWITQESSIHNL